MQRTTERAQAHPSHEGPLNTRAVLRTIEGDGLDHRCVECGERIVFKARAARRKKVVCNVYEGRGQFRKWDRVEQFHEECYDGRHGAVIIDLSSHGRAPGFSRHKRADG